jgi:hypothetical protein
LAIVSSLNSTTIFVASRRYRTARAALEPAALVRLITGVWCAQSAVNVGGLAAEGAFRNDVR